jgi:GWxTD domain-containing protein
MTKQIHKMGWMAGLVLMIMAGLLLSSCNSYNLAKQLPEPYAEFYSRVRYIINKKEERAFLSLDHVEKDQFIVDFWKRRDPDPNTDENEFRTEYFNRMSRADELFISEGRAGWLTDRGRVFVLFGMPTSRLEDPAGTSSYGRCMEVWYYGNFPVVFSDASCTGSYDLMTYDLSRLRSINLQYLQGMGSNVNSTRNGLGQAEDRLFDFGWRMRAEPVVEDRFEAVVFVDIPIANIWLNENDGRLITTLEASLEVFDPEGKSVWGEKKKLEVSVSEEEIKSEQKKSLSFRLPILIAEGVQRLLSGTNRIELTLKNSTGGALLKKVQKFTL